MDLTKLTDFDLVAHARRLGDDVGNLAKEYRRRAGSDQDVQAAASLFAFLAAFLSHIFGARECLDEIEGAIMRQMQRAADHLKAERHAN